MVGPSKSEVLNLLAFNVPGYQVVSTWVEDKLVETPENTCLVFADGPRLAAPVPWGQFESSRIQIPVVTNVETWSSAALWSDDNGTIINSDAPVWAVRETELSQLAAQLVVDSAASVGETVYNVYDAALRALAEMMMVATYKQLFSKTPDPNGPESFYAIATSDATIVDAQGEPLSFRLLTCLFGQLDVNEGLHEQYSVVMGRSLYADFVELMAGVGSEPHDDPIMGRKAWFFDRVRVVESKYVSESDAVMFKADMAVLSPAQRERVSPGSARGVMLASTHAPGVVVSNSKAVEGEDKTLTTLQLNVGLVHGDNCVAWLENVST